MRRWATSDLLGPKRHPGAPWGRRVAVAMDGTQAEYVLGADGNVWLCNPGAVNNCGPLEDFVTAVVAGKWRAVLEEGGEGGRI